MIFLPVIMLSIEVIRWRNREPGGEGQYPYPAIKIAFWQDEKTCHFEAHARFQRYQPLFQSRRKLCALPARLSAGSCARTEGRVRPDARPYGGRYRVRHGHLDSYVAGEWQCCLWHRAECRDA